MREMADPMIALRGFQESLDNGTLSDSPDLDVGCYLMIPDERSAEWKRYIYLRIVNREIQALAIFALESPHQDVACYSVGYAVHENYRGRGLAVEAVEKGLEDLKRKLNLANVERFYLEAVVGVTNEHSIKVAEKLFPKAGAKITDDASGQPALLFHRLIALQ